MASRAHLLLLLQTLPAPLLALTPASFRSSIRIQSRVTSLGRPRLNPSLSCPHQRGGVSVRAEEDDVVTNFFTKIFGKGARDDPEPLGLKRATVEEFPDIWPPTQELGEVLPDDPADVRVFRPLLKQTTLEFQPLLLAYDADRDGWSNKDFRKQMDGSYAAVLVGTTSSGTVFGAYNPAGWLGYGDFRECISAFLFTWVDGDTSKPAAKLPKVGGPSMAVLDQSGKGPQWGPDGLRIDLDSRTAVSRLGSYYQRMPGGGTSMFTKAEGNYADVTSIRIYVAKELSDAAKNYKPKITQWG